MFACFVTWREKADVFSPSPLLSDFNGAALHWVLKGNEKYLVNLPRGCST